MDSEIFNIKNILALISAPLTFILGLCGYHYKKICSKQDELDESVTSLKVVTAEQNVHIAHLTMCATRQDTKLQQLDTKIDEILSILSKR